MAALTTQFAHLGGRVIALGFARKVTPADHDMIVATGELASSRIVAAAFEEQGLPAVWVDARDVLVTDGEHTVAAPDMDATCRRAQPDSRADRRATADSGPRRLHRLRRRPG